MKDVLFIGDSTLANKFQIANQDIDCTIVGKPKYDLSIQEHCDEIIATFDHERIVLTQGLFNDQIWDQLVVNTVSVVYLATKFYEKLSKGQIICVSSASAIWPSWPNIENHRLIYGLSKETVSNFTKHMQRKIYETEKPISIQCYEPCRFASKINNNKQGISLDKVIKDLRYMVDNPHASHMRAIDV